MATDPVLLAALGAEVVLPPFLAWLDVAGDPVRATTWETGLAFAGTGDPDLDGHDFIAVSPTLGSVSAVKRATGGADTVTASLSGIVGPDSDLLNVLGDEASWKGRLARLWFLLLDEDRVTRLGAVVPYYTGRMVDMTIKGAATSQRVEVTIESYLASLTSASNRTYLNQAEYTPGDTSASLSIAVSNGAKNG